MLSEQLNDYVLKNPLLQSVSAEELTWGWQTLHSISKAKKFSFHNHIISIIHNPKHSQGIDIPNEFLPSLIYAHRYFGRILPKELMQKILNPTQTADTIFELNCLGFFQAKHRVVYEPKLNSGKLPDFKIILPNSFQLYIECKNQGMQYSEVNRKFDEVCSKLNQEIGNSPFVLLAWGKGLRTEILFSPEARKGDIAREVNNLSSKLKENDIDSYCNQQKKVTPNIFVTCVPRQSPMRSNNRIKTSLYLVSTSPVKLEHINASLTIYSWVNLDQQIITLQKRLLSKARLKLRALPHNSLGMACLQTYCATNFIPEIKKLISQEEYRALPFVWLNPFNESQLIYRNDCLDFYNTIFQ